VVETPSDFGSTPSYLTTDHFDYALEPSFTSATHSSATSFSDFSLDEIAKDLYANTETANSSFNMPPPDPTSTSAAISTMPVEHDFGLMESWWDANPLAHQELLPDLAVDHSLPASSFLGSHDWFTDTISMTSYSATMPITTSHQSTTREQRIPSAACRAMSSVYSTDSDEDDETYGSSDEVESIQMAWAKRTRLR
jgi:hypothetical protein